MSLEFTDSIDDNFNVVVELLNGVPAGARERAKRAALAIEEVLMRIKKDGAKDPAVGLGVAFAVFMVAKQLVEAQRDDDRPLIQLLS